MFLATLSHEMRTPLNAIVGWLAILRQKDIGAKHLQQGLEVIERNTKAQVQLIDDLLDVSRIVSGKLRVDLQPCELIDVISAGVEVVRPAAAARGVTVNLALDGSASPTLCDSNRMQQVVWNLVSNAVKFTPRGGRIEVTLRRQPSHVEIEVSDSGQGIRADLLPLVFDRFRQADSSTRRQFAGLGLGLSIVRYIVEAHGGSVNARSPGEGQGSTFVVRLPMRAVPITEDVDTVPTSTTAPAGDARGRASVDVRQQRVRLAGVRVLLVDDEADARQVLVMVLEQAGAVVTAVGSAHDALESLADAPPDVLVSDLAMPDRDGFDLIRQVRDQGRDATDLPAVALTAFVQERDAQLALRAGFQVHVPKPVDPHDLTVVIARLVGRTPGGSLH